MNALWQGKPKTSQRNGGRERLFHAIHHILFAQHTRRKPHQPGWCLPQEAAEVIQQEKASGGTTLSTEGHLSTRGVIPGGKEEKGMQEVTSEDFSLPSCQNQIQEHCCSVSLSLGVPESWPRE